MAKAKSPAVSVDELVRTALSTVAASDGEVRLSGKGETPPLFASVAGANGQAVARLRSADPPLVTFRKDGAKEFVRLSAAGFEAVLPELPAERVADVAKRVVADLRAGERVPFLEGVVRRVPTAMPGLLTARAEAADAARAEAEALAAATARQRAAEEATRAAMRDWLRLQDEERKRRVEFLKQQLAAEGEPVQDGEAGAAVRPPAEPTPALAPPTPESPDDIDFRRQVARRLVSSWQEAVRLNRADARRHLETVMGTVAEFRQVGEDGERVAFNGMYYECPHPVSNGASVTVTRPGWVLEEDDGREYVLARALVNV